jgi:hypothetical protein
LKWLLLSLVAIALCLEIAGLTEGFSNSLGHPISGTYAGIPSEFVATTSLVFPILPYMMLVMIGGALLYGVMGPSRANPIDEVQDLDFQKSQGKIREYIVLVSAIAVAALLVWFPRSLQSLPIGGDTLWYMTAVETINREGLSWAIVYTDKPIFYLATYGLQQVSGLSVLDFFTILPVILAVGVTASVWFFVSSFYREAAGYSALLMATSTSLMRTSIDLYASFFATSLLFLTFGLYLRYREVMNARQRSFLQLMLIIILLSYWFVWGLVLVVLLGAEALSERRLRRIKALLTIVLPSMGVLGLFIVISLIRPPPLYWGLGSSFALYFGRTTTPIGSVTYNTASFDLVDVGLLQYNPIVPILAVLGLFFFRPRTFPVRTIYVWSSIMLVFSLISLTGLHAALLVPLPVLAGLGLRKMLDTR